jgi:hypothetical protein
MAPAMQNGSTDAGPGFDNPARPVPAPTVEQNPIMRSIRTSAAMAALVLPLALSACGGSSSDSAGSTTTSTTASASGITQPPPALPFPLGTRAALGEWELSVDRAVTGQTTTVEARLANVSGRAVAAPAPAVFVLRDGATRLTAPARVSGLPARLEPDVDTPITITFVGDVAATDPYLHWDGTTKDAVQGDFKLTPGDPVAPLD